MLVAKVQVSGMPVAKVQVSIMLVATADKLRLYRCSSPRERCDANFCNLALRFIYEGREYLRRAKPATSKPPATRRMVAGSGTD
jgi:hypothetical protein